MEKFRYYVVYSYQADGDLRNGAMEFLCDGPMENAEVRQSVTEQIAVSRAFVVILNWKRIQ